MLRYRKLLCLFGLLYMAGIIVATKNIALHKPLDSTKPVIVVLLGPPGAGKGTHAPALSSFLKIPHISTGDLFRHNIRNQTPIGIKAKEYMDFGKLVPDDIVLAMLFCRLTESDCQKGAILDGFPRTIAQAKSLDSHIEASYRLNVLQLNIDSELLIERVSGRIVCKDCGRPFHKKYEPPKQKDLCDSCGGHLLQRIDDTEVVMRKRMDVYRSQTEPLIEYYKKKMDTLFEINANQSKNLVFEDMVKALTEEHSLAH